MTTLSPDLLRRMHAWWRAANYLSVGQIYLRANPLLEEALRLAHIKPRLVASTYLEGSYSETYPAIRQGRDGMQALFRQFSWPYGIPSHVAPETPGSIHEGCELLVPLVMPEFRDFALAVLTPGSIRAEATRVMGSFVAEVMRLNLPSANFRLFGPDETASNRLGAVIDMSDKAWMADIETGDDQLSADGRVMEVLSEHLCEG